jgi:hypothetical protein
MTFGDSEPEDMWDLGDSVAEKVRQLNLRLDWLDRDPSNQERLTDVIVDFAILPKLPHDADYQQLAQRIREHGYG